MFMRRSRGKAAANTGETSADLRCSFCGHTKDQVRKLAAGPAVFICDECVEVCVRIMADAEGPPAEATTTPSASRSQGAHSMRPGPLALSCSLCGAMTPPDALLFVRGRGALCPGCVTEIQAALDDDDA